MILNIAFYRFQEVSEPLEASSFFRVQCPLLGLKGTVLLSPEGINASLAGPQEQVREFQALLEGMPAWAGLAYKESYSETIPFSLMQIKVKKEIIPAADPEVVPHERTAPRLSASELKQWLDEKRPFQLLDTRNEYEIEYGTFKNATRLGMRHFRNFSDKLRKSAALNPEEPLVMFCTGGIRCEKASVLAQKAGFQEVYQLDGGILKYFEECGDAHYEGKCFVFDERIALDSNLKSPYPNQRG